MLENYPYRGVKGMRDSFPDTSHYYQALETMARHLFHCYQIGEIRTPLVEHTILFERGVGQGTDIVNKEMFYVPAKEQDSDQEAVAARKMVLRPEATASVVRAYVEHEINKQLPGLVRYYYIGPMFRYERPQRGRLRQFTQIGIELIGSDAPTVDSEAIIVLVEFMQRAGLNQLTVELNSVGCAACRPDYLAALIEYAKKQEQNLCNDCQMRLLNNPLRLFDCKQSACRQVLSQAPDIQQHLCSDCKNHQQSLIESLTINGIAFQLNSRLMRGLDYYSRTVFELISKNLGAQNAVAAGGRYDKLVRELDGPDVPAIGWSIGMERVLELIDKGRFKPPDCDLYIIAPGKERSQLLKKVVTLRHRGFSVGFDHEPKSMKALLKKANRVGARFSLFVDEGDFEKIELKNMKTGEQTKMTWNDVIAFMTDHPAYENINHD